MVPLIVFYLHIVGSAAAFTRRWQEEGIGEGILAVFFVALIFFVGWGMTSFIMKIFMAPEGLGKVFDRDSASLTLLTVLESIFYYFYLRADETELAEQQ